MDRKNSVPTICLKLWGNKEISCEPLSTTLSGIFIPTDFHLECDMLLGTEIRLLFNHFLFFAILAKIYISAKMTCTKVTSHNNGDAIDVDIDDVCDTQMPGVE